MDKLNIDYNFEIKETDQDENYFYFSGYGSTKDLDLVNDIVEPTAFNKSLKSKLPVMLWQHDRYEPIGIYTEAVPDDKGLKVRGKMPLDDDFVKGRVVPQLKIGSVDALSIGFIVRKADWDHDKGIRTIKEADLLEVSLVTFPANPEARITGLKALERWAEGKGVTEIKRGDLPAGFAPLSYFWDEKEASGRIKKSGVDYPLNVVDVIKGAPVIVPRAVFTLRALIDGAKGGRQATQEEKNIINELYKDMELDAPFTDEKSAYCLTEIKSLPSGVLCDVLRYKTLSRDAANFVTQAVQTAARGYTSDEADAFKGFLDGLKKFSEVS